MVADISDQSIKQAKKTCTYIAHHEMRGQED